jgi:hypothetical protein
VVSPITGEEEAAPSGRGYVFRVDPTSMERWREWWRKANIEQFVSFFVVGAITIVVFSLVADVLRVGYLRGSKRWTESRL